MSGLSGLEVLHGKGNRPSAQGKGFIVEVGWDCLILLLLIALSMRTVDRLFGLRYCVWFVYAAGKYILPNVGWGCLILFVLIASSRKAIDRMFGLECIFKHQDELKEESRVISS